MALPNTVNFGERRREHALSTPITETAMASSTAVSWAAIFAGAAGAAALSLILLMLGTGLGLSPASPWSHEGIGQTSVAASSIAWVTFSQMLASGTGGYLAGRLRTRWVEVQRDEAHFRDTAHGFLAWAVASLVTATMLTQVVGAAPSSGVQTMAAEGPNTAQTEVDQRFMLSPHSEADPMNGVRHAGQLITPQQPGRTQQDAKAGERKASAHSALWAFVALLSGAFVGSLAATVGGRKRDA